MAIIPDVEFAMELGFGIIGISRSLKKNEDQ